MHVQLRDMDQSDPIIDLMFSHVTVETLVKRSNDFTSDFSSGNADSEETLCYNGHLKAADPISGSVVLCDIDRETNRVIKSIMIIGNVIDNVKPSSQICIPKEIVLRAIELERQCLARAPYFRKNLQDLTRDQIIERRDEIMSWLQSCFVHVEHDDSTNEISISSTKIRVRPPYERDSDYICPTRIVLQRFKGLIDSRPNKSHQQSGAGV